MVALKREKMACQRSMTQKKEREKGSHVSKKIIKREEKKGIIRERTAIRSKSYPSIHPLIHLHLLIEIA